MLLIRRLQPFTHPDWIFEIQWDGLRLLAFIENGRCRLMSKFHPYLLDNAKWYKITNRNRSQWAGREKLFERERLSDSDWHDLNS